MTTESLRLKRTSQPISISPSKPSRNEGNCFPFSSFHSECLDRMHLSTPKGLFVVPVSHLSRLFVVICKQKQLFLVNADRKSASVLILTNKIEDCWIRFSVGFVFPPCGSFKGSRCGRD